MIQALESRGERETIIGIDLGTTNSSVAIVENGAARVLPVDGKPLLPSAVGLGPDGELLVGESALNQLLHAPERTVLSVKRRMGTSERLRLGDVEHSPQEVSAMVLRRLKAEAERQLGREVQKAVITVPAFFGDAARQATRDAGELAGLDVVRILHEPTAAALMYEADHLGEEDRLRRILVYDMGGGTFDVSLVEMRGGVVEVRASHGDTHLGGDDFDDLLLRHVAERFRQEHGVDLLGEPRVRARLRRAVEQAKCRLSSEPSVQLEEEFVAESAGKPLHLSMELARHEYDEMIRPLVLRSMDSVQVALADAKVLAGDLDEVILVGGSTRTPLVQSELAARLGREAKFEVDPDLCVALGAASQAALIAGEDVRRVLVDITPHSLGVRCLWARDGDWDHDHFSRVLAKGTVLPALRSEVYRTTVDEQKEVQIEVYQGEDDAASQNTLLGDFLVRDLSPSPAGNPIVVEFRLTLDGILEVTAREKKTGRQNQIRIAGQAHGLAGEEREQARRRLSGLFAASRDVDGEAGAAGSGVGSPDSGREGAAEGEGVDGPRVGGPRVGGPGGVLAFLHRVEQALGDMVEEDREEANELVRRVHRGVAAGDDASVEEARQELEEILFYVEENREP